MAGKQDCCMLLVYIYAIVLLMFGGGKESKIRERGGKGNKVREEGKALSTYSTGG